ncbi:MAG: nucleotidyltransferase family protein [Bryobacteraceae bacterium]
MKDGLQCVVLAGGLGTRMRPLTDSMPKSMLPVAGRPFAEHQLEFLIENGVDDVVYLIGYRGEAIRRHFGDGRRWGIRIRYVDEGSTLRGTGGALRLALAEGALAPAFLLIYGDSFTPVSIPDVRAAFEASSLPALMTVLCNEERWDRSNVLFEDNRIVVYDKTRTHPRSGEMRHIDYGLSALRREVVAERIPQSAPADLAPVFHQLSLEGRLAGFEATRRFYEIGSPGGLPDFESYLLAGSEARG